MSALLYPVNPTKGDTQWGLVAHTTTMFVFSTVAIALGLDLQSICYVDDRNFPGFNDGEALGPFAYQLFVYSKPINVVPNLMFLLNQWLADGLLVSSMFDQTPRYPTSAAPPAVSLLHHLFHEVLDRRLPLPGVPRLFGYVLDSYSTRQWCSRLALLIQ